jgi:hypothetical protein
MLVEQIFTFLHNGETVNAVASVASLAAQQ